MKFEGIRIFVERSFGRKLIALKGFALTVAKALPADQLHAHNPLVRGSSPQGPPTTESHAFLRGIF